MHLASSATDSLLGVSAPVGVFTVADWCFADAGRLRGCFFFPVFSFLATAVEALVATGDSTLLIPPEDVVGPADWVTGHGSCFMLQLAGLVIARGMGFLPLEAFLGSSGFFFPALLACPTAVVLFVDSPKLRNVVELATGLGAPLSTHPLDTPTGFGMASGGTAYSLEELMSSSFHSVLELAYLREA